MTLQEREALEAHRQLRQERKRARRRHKMASRFVRLNLLALGIGVFWFFMHQ